MIGPALELTYEESPPAAMPDYTTHCVRNRDGMWTVVVTVTATGQELRCSYYAEPKHLNVPAIAARLYGLRRRG